MEVCEVFYHFPSYLLIALASRSASTLVGVATLVFFDIMDSPHLVFKQCPHIAKVHDSVSAFSRDPDGVLYVEDDCRYINCTLEDLGFDKIKTMYMSIFLNWDGSMKLDFQVLKD